MVPVPDLVRVRVPELPTGTSTTKSVASGPLATLKDVLPCKVIEPAPLTVAGRLELLMATVPPWTRRSLARISTVAPRRMRLPPLRYCSALSCQVAPSLRVIVG
jgi:hypothetical protein